MKRYQKLMAMALATILVGGGTLTAFAASYGSPKELAAAVTESTLEEVDASGQRAVEYAAAQGALAAFREGLLEMKRERMESKVQEGIMTQEQVEAMLGRMEQRMAAGETGYQGGLGERPEDCTEAGFGGFGGFQGKGGAGVMERKAAGDGTGNGPQGNRGPGARNGR